MSATSIPKGARLHRLTASLPVGAAHPPPVTLTLTDSTGKVRAQWSVGPGEGIDWSDLAGFPVDDTWTVTIAGPGKSTLTYAFEHKPQ